MQDYRTGLGLQGIRARGARLRTRPGCSCRVSRAAAPRCSCRWTVTAALARSSELTSSIEIQDHRVVGLSLPAPNWHCPDHHAPVLPAVHRPAHHSPVENAPCDAQLEPANRVESAASTAASHLPSVAPPGSSWRSRLDRPSLPACFRRPDPRSPSSKLRIRAAGRWLPRYRALGNRWLHLW